MKLALISDTHFEYHKDGGKEFIGTLDSSEADVLLLAGDIATVATIDLPIQLLCNKYKQVIMVAGNHHYWGSTRTQVLKKQRELQQKYKNLFILENNIFVYEGQRFIGTPLWFDDKYIPPDLKRDWADYHAIKNFDKWVGKANAKAQKFLQGYLQKGDVVLTHYLPTYQSVAKEWVGSVTNAFFVCSMEELIRERKPALWCFGHTHSSNYHTIENTRLFCNPFGYAEYSLNKNFNQKLIIEV